MVPLAPTETIRALSSTARDILRNIGVTFDFQLASLDLKEVDLPPEDVNTIRDAVHHAPQAPCDVGKVGAGRPAVDATDAGVSTDEVFSLSEETGDREPPAAADVAENQDDSIRSKGDPNGVDEAGVLEANDTQRLTRRAREASLDAKLAGQGSNPKRGQTRWIRTASCALYFLIWESVLRCIAAESARWPRLETGGDMYGLWTRGARAVVMLVVGPGPNAVHEPTHFVQDIDFFRANTEFLHETFGLQYVGPWHSHWELQLDEPSDGDIKQIRSISTRNNLSHLVEIITTHRRMARSEAYSPPRLSHGGTAPLRWWWWPRSSRRSDAVPDNGICVKVNAFEHTDPQSGQHERCCIDVLRGVSPFRLALMNSATLDHPELATENSDFPMDRLLFDSLEQSGCDTQSDAREAAIPEALVEQCDRLPRTVAEEMTVSVRDTLIILELPTPSQATVFVAYEREAPETPLAVGFKPSDHRELIDTTEYALADGPGFGLDEIHARMASFDPCQDAPVAAAKGAELTGVMPAIRTLPEWINNRAEL